MYKILTEFDIFTKSVRLVRECLNKTHGKINTGKHLSDAFLIQHGLKQADALLPLIFTSGLGYPIGKVKKIMRDSN
jgi:hypothetical protein